MKEFFLTAPYQIEFREYADAPLKPNEVRVRSIVSGIKHGTEMSLYRGKTPFTNASFDSEYRMFMPRPEGGSFYPLNLGSWLAGEVVEIGSAVTRFKIGDKVHGALAHRPTNTRGENGLYRLPEGMSPETALFTDPALFALCAVHDAQVKVGDNVAIFGMGALGLLAVQIARMSGADEVFAVDTVDSRLELARQFGADEVYNPAACDPALEIKNRTGKKGVDVAIDISGSYAALSTAMRCIQMCGVIVLTGFYSGTPQIDLGGDSYHNRATFVTSMPVWGNPHRSYPLWDLQRLERTALGLLASGRLKTDGMVGQRYRYEDAAQAYQFIDAHPYAAVKTLLDYDPA